MDVKVGQAWKNKKGDRSGSMDKIIVGKAELHMILNALRNDVSERGMVNRQEMIELVENSLVDYEDHINDIKSSDLEIVQKALCIEDVELTLGTGGSSTFVTNDYKESVRYFANNTQLLTWAKQTIGAE